MKGRDKTSGCASLTEVLRALGFDGKTALVRELRRSGCLKPARQACRALCEAVDCCLSSLDVMVRDEDRLRWASGHLLPLQRWTSLTSLSVSVNSSDVAPLHPLERGVHFTLPFEGHLPECTQRLTHVRLACPWPHVVPGLMLATLLRSMPSLRSVGLNLCLDPEPIDEQSVLHALASLPHLATIELPVTLSLAKAGVLADKLTSLRLSDVEGYNAVSGNQQLEPPACIAALPQLRALRSLYLDVRSARYNLRTVRLLLDNLPPGLRILVWPSCSAMETSLDPDLCFELKSGHISELDIGEEIYLGPLARFVSEALLPSRALGKRLPVLRLQTAVVQADDFETPELPALRLLLQRCQLVEVGELQFDGEVEVDLQMSAWRLLRKPEQVAISDNYVRLHLPNPDRHSASAASDGGGVFGAGLFRAAPRSPEPSPPLFPSPADAFRLALQNMAAAAASAAANPLARSQRRVRSGPDFHLVLLSGPFIELLGWNPATLNEWMTELARKLNATMREAVAAGVAHPLAAATPGHDNNGGEAGTGAGGDANEAAAAGRPSYLAAHLHVPCASAVVVQCRTAEAARRLPAVARALRPGTEAAAKVADLLADLELEATPLAAPEPGELDSLADDNYVHDAFKIAANEVARQVWDGRLGGGGSDEARMRWVFEMWAGIVNLPSLIVYL